MPYARSEKCTCCLLSGSLYHSAKPLSPLVLIAEAPSSTDFLTNATTSALVLYFARAGFSSGASFIPCAGFVKTYIEPATCSNCSAKVRCAGVGLKLYFLFGKNIWPTPPLFHCGASSCSP